MKTLMLILILIFILKQIKDQNLCKCIYVIIGLLIINGIFDVYDGYCNFPELSDDSGYELKPGASIPTRIDDTTDLSTIVQCSDGYTADENDIQFVAADGSDMSSCVGEELNPVSFSLTGCSIDSVDGTVIGDGSSAGYR